MTAIDSLPPRVAGPLAEIERLAQGQGLTYAERQHLVREAPDRAFLEQRLDELARAQVWQPLAIAAVALVGFALVLVSQIGAERTAWWFLILYLPALHAPWLKRRQIARRRAAYRALLDAASPDGRPDQP